MQETSKNSGFLFANFLEGLTGEITSRVALEVKGHLNTGKLQIVFNPAVQISQITKYSGGDIVLFLPNDYSHDDAMIEYPRILSEIIKYSRELDNNARDLGGIEEKLRAEARKI